MTTFRVFQCVGLLSVLGGEIHVARLDWDPSWIKEGRRHPSECWDYLC